MAELHLDTIRQLWDDEAERFDNEPDHGLRDPVIRHAWTEQLKRWLPSASSSVLDIGCGTGSLSVIIAALGHRVTGVDVSPAMLAKAQEKAAAEGVSVDFRVMDAANPHFTTERFDVIVCRHLLWALPKPADVLQRWTCLLNPSGQMVLIEGYWYTNAGMHSADVVDALPAAFAQVSVENLSDQIDLWGRAVTDERYVVRAFAPIGATPSSNGEPATEEERKGNR